ncbi:MAG TPA: hypothetical protein VG672_15100, partial [Bryobacteraceae bacterium]|nr:hypothetical protein [Bryobacteraceae bacterium]
LEAAAKERGDREPLARSGKLPAPDVPFVAMIDPEQVRAAVTLAVDASMADTIDEITRRVLAALTAKPAPR